MSDKEKTMEEICAYPIFKGQRVQFPKKIEGDYTLTVAMNPQKYNYLHIDETGQHSKVIISPVEGEKQHRVFIPSKKDTFPNWEIKNDLNEHFWTVKPKTESLTFNLDYGSKTVPLTLPQIFFEGNEPIHIVTSHWNLQETTHGQGNKNQKLFVMPAVDALQYNCEEPLVMTEITAETMKMAGFKIGENKILENIDNDEDRFDLRDFIKSLLTNTSGGIGQVYDNYAILKEFFPNGKFYIKKVKGKYYVIFKGLSGHRKEFKGIKYALNNPKLISLSIAKRPITGSFEMLKESFKSLKGTIISVLVVGAIDLSFWLHDGIFSEGGFYLSELLIDIGSDFVKGMVGTVAAAIAIGFACSFFVAGAIPIIVVVGGTIALSIIFGAGLDYLDHELRVTKTIQEAAKKVEEKMRANLNEQYINPIAESISNLESAIRHLYFGNLSIPGF